jgi:hypothetical protein
MGRGYLQRITHTSCLQSTIVLASLIHGEEESNVGSVGVPPSDSTLFLAILGLACAATFRVRKASSFVARETAKRLIKVRYLAMLHRAKTENVAN